MITEPEQPSERKSLNCGKDVRDNATVCSDCDPEAQSINSWPPSVPHAPVGAGPKSAKTVRNKLVRECIILLIGGGVGYVVPRLLCEPVPYHLIDQWVPGAIFWFMSPMAIIAALCIRRTPFMWGYLAGTIIFDATIIYEICNNRYW